MQQYGELSLQGKQWVMTRTPPHVSIRLKHLFPRINKSETDVFCFPNTPMICADLTWFLSRYPMDMSEKDQRHLRKQERRFQSDQAQMGAILKPDYQPTARAQLREGQTLRSYQGVAADLALSRQALLLGDEVGLGKTYSAAGMLCDSRTLPAAVVVQAHLQMQWKQKLEEFTELKVHLIDSTTPYNLPVADVYVFKYSALYGWVDVFQTGYFKSVVYDEVQELRRGKDSNKGQGALVLSGQATYKLGLSATPIYNYGSEIWNIMRVIDPDVLGSEYEFQREWLIGDKQVRDPEALGSYLREQRVFLRRRAVDVGRELPPVNTLVEYVDTDLDALRSIEQRAQSLAMRITNGSYVERGQAAREFDLLVRQSTGVAKAKGVADYVRLLLEAGMPVILAGWHREVYEIWLRELAAYKPLMYTGSESIREKERMKQRFIDGESKLLILSLRSGVGLDGLQHVCSTVAVGELDWSPRVHDQLIGRVNREGQEDEVHLIYLVADEGSDPPLIELLGLKSSQSHGIIDPDLPMGTRHSDDSRIKELAKRYLQRAEQMA